MTKQAESRLQMKIRKALATEVGGWWFKVWGGAFQQAGIPDIVGCVDGFFFAFEVKTEKGKTSKLQEYTIESIAMEGGTALVIRTPQEAVDAVKNRLGKTRSVPKGRR